jgi:hypothetical protein
MKRARELLERSTSEAILLIREMRLNLGGDRKESGKRQKREGLTSNRLPRSLSLLASKVP